MNPLECKKCDLILSSVSNENRHDEEQHSDKPRLECEICDMSFMNKSNLATHFTRASHRSAVEVWNRATEAARLKSGLLGR